METGHQDVQPTEEHTEEHAQEVEAKEEKLPKSSTSESSKNAPKHDKFSEAKQKLEVAKNALAQTDDEVENCLKKIDEDMARFNEAHTALKEQTLQPTHALMEALGADEQMIQTHIASPVLEANDPSIAAVDVPVISKGVLKGLVMALIGMLLALGAWCYTATQALGLPLLPEKFPDFDRVNKAFAWTAQQLGQGENIAVGSVIVLVAALFLGAVLFWLTRLLRDGKNLKVAKKIEEETEFYCSKKGECKQQMEKIREHISHAQKTVETYTVLLDELKARLSRARFVEEADTFAALHAKTQSDIKTTHRLITEVTEFLATPMAQSGVLNKEGIDALEKATTKANKYVMELYA